MSTRTLNICVSISDFFLVDQTTTLLTTQNFESEKHKENSVHTTLGDLEWTKIIEAAKIFDHVVFHKSPIVDPAEELYLNITLNIISQFKPVKNFSVLAPETYTTHKEARDNCPVLWSIGDSFVTGDKLDDEHLRYDQIVAQNLKLPLKRVSKKASATHWALREIAAADIRNNDVVIWFVSSNFEKIAIAKESVYNFLPAHLNERDALDIFAKTSNVHIGTCILRSKNARFVLISANSNGSMLEMLSRYPEYLLTDHLHTDYESDGLHYGKNTFKSIGELITKHFQKTDND